MKLNEILENISFHNILIFKKNEQLKLLRIRNERVVRSNMFNNKIISYIDHFDWIDSLKTCLNKKFYIVKYKNKIIGGLGLKNINKISFSFYLFPVFIQFNTSTFYKCVYEMLLRNI